MTKPPDDQDVDRPWTPPFISRVRLTNYKSIADCDVRLGPLTILVGPNGSGKSNFLDALALVARALETTPNEAIDERGGMADIARRVPSPTDSFSVGVEVSLPWGAKAKESAYVSYEFEVGRVPGGGPSTFEIINEVCELRRGDQAWRFRARHGEVLDETRGPRAAKVPPDRLYLAFAQSADLLDRDDLDASIIRPVVMQDGLTVIGEVDDASREIVKKKLYTLGELMRGSQLAPKPSQ